MTIHKKYKNDITTSRTLLMQTESMDEKEK